MHVFRQALILFLATGILAIAFGVGLLLFYLSNSVSINLLGGFFFIGFGAWILVRGYPTKLQQKTEPTFCSNCGAPIAEDAVICEKCKQQTDTVNSSHSE
jgi:ribosomal protein L40E